MPKRMQEASMYILQRMPGNAAQGCLLLEARPAYSHQPKFPASDLPSQDTRSII